MNAPLEIPVAILAGGLATRLRPITGKIPKSLVPVAGKPFLAHQLEMLHARGIRRAVLCIGYLGEMIQRDFGDEAFGVKLDYSFDGEKLLGTGGAIKRALPLLGKDFFVLYGDSYLPIEFAPIAEAFHRSGKLGLMTVYRNEGKYDTSNVIFADGEIKIYEKKLNTHVQILCNGLPDEFIQFIIYTRQLGFAEEPNYSYLLSLIKQIFSSMNIKRDFVYDWIVNKPVKIFHT